ncbi:CPBP family intramembrane metalloprotease [Kutzneria viridogrisea]|uniref:CAAX prenyl protease 2/Lysostaphin resistance protein A-like domain-containing protein n=1 Tax=Kutzneria viridogrisea TaxID=47990 RepID=A0ABR6BBD5_9PSEU|nr:hypothetical protein [Kutzneria viridogrisea]
MRAGRRRGLVAATLVTGSALLGASLSTEPGTARFYGMTAGVAGVWAAGGLASGSVRANSLRGPVLGPALLGVGAFAAFYGCALLARRVPVLDRAITGVLSYAHRGSDRWVLATTLANGLAEELFFRGAVYEAVQDKHPVALSTALYALATAATRNPALVLASLVMGALFAVQRRVTGGVLAPVVTHLVWSTLMLRYLPPLFRVPR